LQYAANHDEEIYQLLDRIKITERQARPPEILNSTLSSKKLFDTFGIKTKSWHGNLKETIQTLYVDRLPSAGNDFTHSSTESYDA
jgi:dTDP-4-dehydrorhamnose reductase